MILFWIKIKKNIGFDLVLSHIDLFKSIELQINPLNQYSLTQSTSNLILKQTWIE
jgi:hypothetical protein